MSAVFQSNAMGAAPVEHSEGVWHAAWRRFKGDRVGLVSMLANRDFKRLGDLAAGTVVVYQAEKAEANKHIPPAPAIAPPVALTLEEQRAVLDLAERSVTLTQERVEELAELPTPLVGRLHGGTAAMRLLGIANHIAGR